MSSSATPRACWSATPSSSPESRSTRSISSSGRPPSGGAASDIGPGGGSAGADSGVLAAASAIRSRTVTRLPSAKSAAIYDRAVGVCCTFLTRPLPVYM